MRDALETKRTRRYRIGTVLTGRTVRTADAVATVVAQVAAGALTTINGATFGLFDSPTADDSCSITSGLAVLTSPNNPWTAADVGKAIDVQGAGAAGATLRSRIKTYTSAGSVTLWDNAGTTVAALVSSAGGLAMWGNDLNETAALPKNQNEAATSELAKVAVSTVATGGTALRTVADRLADLINVKDFGAVGDGVTDDLVAIQRAITVAQVKGGAVYFPPAVYRITAQIAITASVSLIGLGKPGPRVYADPLTVYGGAEIIADWTPAANTDTDAFALKIDVGTIGAEGYANVRVQGIGFAHKGPKGGGIYVEAGVGVTIEQCRFSGDLDLWTAGTLTGIGIYARDMIVSRVNECQFFRIAYGVIGDDYFNENAIEHCDFFNCYTLPIGIYAVTNESIRNTIRRNNFTGDPAGANNTSAIRIAGKCVGITIAENTFEAVRLNTIFVNGDNPLTLAAIGSSPKSTAIIGNTFIACCGGQAGGANVSIGAAVVHLVSERNSLFSPTVNNDAILSVAAGATFIYSYGDQPLTKLHASGDTTAVVIDNLNYRTIPLISSEGFLSAWTASNPAALWQRSGGRISVWNGTRRANLSQEGNLTDATADTTPSVIGLSIIVCNSGGAYAITALDDGQAGQTVTIFNTSGAATVTITHSATMRCDGAADKVLAIGGGSITFISLGGNQWVQCGIHRAP